VSEKENAKKWLTENRIEDVEAFVPDMAGAARGKVIPADKFTEQNMKMPEAVFSQTISGEYIDDPSNREDRDMILKPDYDTLRPVPWAVDPAASVFLDCLRLDDQPVATSPRQILRQVLELYERRGWRAIVAPEVEFYLIKSHTDPDEEVEPPEGRLGRTDLSRQPYSIDTMNDFEPFIMDVYKFCDDQGIRIDTLSQEMGPAQFEINFLHGDPVDLADQVFLFKRTVREAAIRHEMHATFLSKPMADEPGSALHIHQSVVSTEDGSNVFSTPEGEPSELFYSFLGGLQKYIPESMLVLAPYVNSYRRFQTYSAAPVNLAWAIDNRTVGLRVPQSGAENRRIENRLAGSDVNPYLATAVTLACGYLGMVEGLQASEPVTGSAYDGERTLPWNIWFAIESLQTSAAMRATLGDRFVDLYCGLKKAEYAEFEHVITPWERELLLLNV